jgi:nucleotide-binding universal stress UspA family protein
MRRSILTPLDGSEISEAALPWAVKLAQDRGLALVLARVVEYPQMSSEVWGPSAATTDLYEQVLTYEQEQATQYLAELRERLSETGLPVQTVVQTGSPVVALLDLVDQIGADTIVMASHGRSGLKRLVLGSVADEVARSVDRPVFLVSARAAARSVAGRALVGEVMTPGVMALQEDEPLVVALRKLVRRRASGAPVLGAEGNVTGVISQRDILAWHARTIDALAQDRQPTPETYLQLLRTEPVSAVMTSPAATIAETATVDAALALMRERGLHRLPVTRNGTLVGIITGSDILLAMLGQLESGHAEYRAEELQPTAEELIAAGA